MTETDPPRWMRRPGSHFGRGLLELCRHLQGAIQVRRMAEVGVWCGESTEVFAEHLKPDHYYAVDNWKCGGPKDWRPYESARAEFERVAARISQHTRISILHGDSLEMAKQVEDASLDLVYIDAGHRYDHVRADILAWLPKVAPGGLIAGHDYAFQSNAVGKRYGVVRAVHEIFYCPDLVFEDFSWVVRPTRERCRIGKHWKY